ncbi:MAG TPA: hypothetical protein VHS79_16445 [Actinomycetes bacterium]|jgi:hypothetical protein|nr:hypothetical protein [Actinomycetes bacterium]
MKRIRLLVLAGVIAAALPFGMTAAGATGTTGSSSYVTINDKADYDFIGTNIDVGLQVRCKDSTGYGTVNVTVKQGYPQTIATAVSDGPQAVVCDGRTHSVAVTTIGAGFDAGWAKATATLTTPTNSRGNKTVTEPVYIVAV